MQVTAMKSYHQRHCRGQRYEPTLPEWRIDHGELVDIILASKLAPGLQIVGWTLLAMKGKHFHITPGFAKVLDALHEKWHQFGPLGARPFAGDHEHPQISISVHRSLSVHIPKLLPGMQASLSKPLGLAGLLGQHAEQVVFILLSGNVPVN